MFPIIRFDDAKDGDAFLFPSDCSARVSHIRFRLTVATKHSAVARTLKLKQRRPRLVLEWVTVRENRALWTWVRSSVWTLICNLYSRHRTGTEVKWIKPNTYLFTARPGKWRYSPGARKAKIDVVIDPVAVLMMSSCVIHQWNRNSVQINIFELNIVIVKL